MEYDPQKPLFRIEKTDRLYMVLETSTGSGRREIWSRVKEPVPISKHREYYLKCFCFGNFTKGYIIEDYVKAQHCASMIRCGRFEPDCSGEWFKEQEIPKEFRRSWRPSDGAWPELDESEESTNAL